MAGLTSRSGRGMEWERVFDAIKVPMFVVDVDMRVLHANAAFATCLGCERDELIGGLFPDIVQRRELPHRRAVAAEPVDIQGFLDGLLQVEMSPVHDSDGRLLGTACVARDQAEMQDLRSIRLEAERAHDEILSFEALLARLSEDFVGALPDAIDGHISRSLEEICQVLGIDRGVVWQFLNEEACLLTHSRTSVDMSTLAVRRLTAAQVPWLWPQIRADKIVCMRDVEELPSDADVDLQTVRSIALVSHLLVPLKAGGEVLGVLSFGSTDRSFNWSEKLIQRLTFIATIFAAAIARKRAHAALAERLAFEEALSDLSALLASATPEVLRQAIGLMLARVCKLLGCQRAALLELSGESGQMAVRQVHVEPGTTGSAESEVNTEPWYLDRLRQGEMIVLRNSADQPPHELAEWAARCRVVSHVAVPISTRGRTTAAIAFDSLAVVREWSDEMLWRLGPIGELVASAVDWERSEAALQELRTNLAHLGRLRSAGEMVAAIAHELNQPLTAILNNVRAGSNFLEGPEPDLQEVDTILGDVAADAKRAGDIIRRLRDYLRRGVVKREPLHVGNAVEEVGLLIANEARLRRVRLQLSIDPALPPVLGDRVQIQEVVLNLVMNALEAMEQVEPQSRTLTITCVAGDEHVVVTVDDTGPGLPSGEANVFEAFVTTKKEGMGMGLSIVRTIVEAHGGRLQAVSKAAPGARFEVRLPY